MQIKNVKKSQGVASSVTGFLVSITCQFHGTDIRDSARLLLDGKCQIIVDDGTSQLLKWAEPGTLVLKVGSYSAREIIQRLIHCTQALSAAYKIPESTKSS